MKKPKWVLFDVGGVLLDWRRSSMALAKYLDVNYDEMMEAMFRQAPVMNIGKVSPRDGWKIILQNIGKTGDPLEIIRRWRHTDYWFKDTLLLLDELNESGYQLAVLSNSWLGLSLPEEADTFPGQMKLFSVILDSSLEGIKKPDIEFYKLAEKRTGASASEVYFIDDDQVNLRPAEVLGWQTFHYKSDNGGVDSNNQLRNLLLNS